MEYRIGFFIFIFIFSFLQYAVHADSIPNFFSDYNDFKGDVTSYDPEMFDEESSPLSSFLDDTDDSDTGGLFTSSNQDDCSSWMSSDDSHSFSVEQEARLRPRAESCPNQESSKLDPGLPNFGVFKPGSNLFNLVNPPETPLEPPTQVFPETPDQDQDPVRRELDRIFGLPTTDHLTTTTHDDDDDPCPSFLVSDLAIPVCDSGDWARDVLRIAGEYFFDLFNILAYVKAYPCMLPRRLWCCYSVGLDHHPSYPPDAPLVGVGRLCLNPAIESSPPANDDRKLPIGRDPGKPLIYP